MIERLVGGTLGPGGHLVWTAPDGVIVVAAAVALAAWVASLPGARPLAARVAEALLWASALVVLVVALGGPVWVEERGRTEEGRVVALVDASGSMGVRERGGARSAQALEVLAGLGADVEVFHFGDTLAPGAPPAFDRPATDVEAALLALSDRYAGEKLAAVVLVTDGIDRGPLRQRFRADEEPLPPKVPGPLTVFQVGEASSVQDLAVRAADAGGYAYVHTPFRIHAELQGEGFAGRSVDVRLLRDGSVVSSQAVTLDAAGVGQAVFEVTPESAGRFAYLVQVPDYEGDAVPGNNAWPLVVRVVRDRIRVLQVAGAPSWDVKFLRRFLKGDPSIDLVSFFILRTREDLDQGWSERELSLIEFPYEQLFAEDLSTFDLVIFQNFDHRPYFLGQSDALLARLADYVRAEGHAFVMVGGDRSFSLGDYGGTPLGEVLPVGVSQARTPADETVFTAQLTAAGARHPITRLVGDADENAAWWGRLHTLDGTNADLEVAPGATVLLEHPTLRTPSGKPFPVLAVREVGAGRTMTLSVDSSWRWSLSEAAVGRGNQAYLRFWKNAFRWLVADPTTARVTADTARENYALGDEVRLVVTVRDEAFAPAAGTAVTATVRAPDGTQMLEAETTAEGEAILAFRPTSRGAHRVVVEAKRGAAVVGADETVFAVTSRDPELDDVAPDPAFLSWLAQRTGGRYHGVGERGPVLRDPAAARVVWDRSEVALGRSPVVGLLAAGFAGLAWGIRRRAGAR